MTASQSRGAVLCETGERRTHRSGRRSSVLRVRMKPSLPSPARQGSRAKDCRRDDADHQPVDPQAARHAARKEEGACTAAEPAETWRVHARLHHDAEEAELGLAQGCEGAAYQRL